MKLVFIRTIIALHLFLITLGVTHLDWIFPSNWLGYTAAVISDINRSGWSYGFFSKEHGKVFDMNFQITLKDNTVITHNTAEGFDFFSNNQENKIRFYGLKGRIVSDSLSQDLYTRSLAAKFLNIYPESKKVKVDILKSQFPEMRAYKSIGTIRYDTLFSSTFELL